TGGGWEDCLLSTCRLGFYLVCVFSNELLLGLFVLLLGKNPFFVTLLQVLQLLTERFVAGRLKCCPTPATSRQHYKAANNKGRLADGFASFGKRLHTRSDHSACFFSAFFKETTAASVKVTTTVSPMRACSRREGSATRAVQ